MSASPSIFSWTQDAPLFAKLRRTRSILTPRMCQHGGCWQTWSVSFWAQKIGGFHHLGIENRSCATSPRNLRSCKAAAAVPLDPEVPLFGVWRLGRIGWEFSGSAEYGKNHSTLMEYFDFYILPYFDILTIFQANASSILPMLFDRNRHFLDPLPREKV